MSIPTKATSVELVIVLVTGLSSLLLSTTTLAAKALFDINVVFMMPIVIVRLSLLLTLQRLVCFVANSDATICIGRCSGKLYLQVVEQIMVSNQPDAPALAL